jgi:FK506-binding nuclear protein
VKILPSGLQIEDLQQGDGARAKNGKRVSVRYIGKLTNGKTFDSNTKGKPFSFVLGKGQVIKGWDLGVQGMQIGGVRRLVCPPKLAYGTQGAPPDIPKNATLVFEIKLLDVK